MRFETDRCYQLPVPPADLWSALERVEDYREWWPWLRRFDAVALTDDEIWHCLVQPPLPYRVRLDLTLEEVLPPRRIHASISGDIIGTATVEISDRDGGSEARLVSCLEPGNGLLKVVSRLAAPVSRFGHDWVLDSGARQFIDRAL